MKKNEKKLELDPKSNWARVELWRWQYGELPESNDSRPLIVSIALEAMAKALLNGEVKPSSFNVAIVLKYVAHLLGKEVKE